MAGDDDDVVDVMAPLMKQFRERFTAKGLRRVSYQIEADGLVIDLSGRDLLSRFLEAAMTVIRDEWAGISELPSQATVAFREKAAKALAAGESWAKERYSGGRLGTMQPDPSGGLFADSGRTLASLVGRISGGKPLRITIEAAANRFAKMTEAQLQRLLRLVPSLNPEHLLRQESVATALQEGVDAMTARSVEEIRRRTEQAERRLNRQIAGAVARGLRRLAGR